MKVKCYFCDLVCYERSCKLVCPQHGIVVSCADVGADL